MHESATAHMREERLCVRVRMYVPLERGDCWTLEEYVLPAPVAEPVGLRHGYGQDVPRQEAHLENLDCVGLGSEGP